MRYTSIRSRAASDRLSGDADCSSDIAKALSRRLVGQPAAISAVVPYVEMYRARLTPEGRPAGIFLLLGPTGTGKTKTVEALADVLHGSPKKLLKVDCGEYQMEHEVAKLLGAPPGYLGHRETQPLLTQQKLAGAASESCDLSILLFDEIEKAAPSLVRLLLGVLDKATLRLGDSTVVNFEKSMIFLTSNLGARDMGRELRPEFGFESGVPREDVEMGDKLERIGKNAVRNSFSPEFINRLDSVVTYRPLDATALTAILDQHIEDLQDHVDRRLGERAFRIHVPARSRKFLLEKGTSPEYGARELKRTIHHQLMRPLVSLVVSGEIQPGASVRAEVGSCKTKLVLRPSDEGELLPAC
ncbi:MAG TPA: AAA family ATPase [Bryobacteraceae bacterium]|nr:AAA family ATPase [Bryobacteraceae bacterium]